MANAQSYTDSYLSHVRDALTHLFDTAHLQSHPLAAHLVPTTITDPIVRAQAITETLLQAITDLKPPPGVSPRDPAYRPYAVLRHKYAEGASNEEIQNRLSISRRQFFREQQRAVEALAAILWERRLTRPGDQSPEHQTLADELEQLGLQPRAFVVTDVVQQAIDAVRSLTDYRGVAVTLSASGAAQAFADEALTRQLLVSLLSALAQTIGRAYLALEVRDEGRWVAVRVSGMARGLDDDNLEAHLKLAMQLAQRVGARLTRDRADGAPVLTLLLPSVHELHIVIVDDNPRTLRLFQRYLASHRYRVTTVQDGAAALEEIGRLMPDAVLLDVMMRDMDGWQILQKLKADPDTHGVPVIVCSVLGEEELARTIGADGYLRKPVSQSALALALAQVRQA